MAVALDGGGVAEAAQGVGKRLIVAHAACEHGRLGETGSRLVTGPLSQGCAAGEPEDPGPSVPVPAPPVIAASPQRRSSVAKPLTSQK